MPEYKRVFEFLAYESALNLYNFIGKLKIHKLEKKLIQHF